MGCCENKSGECGKKQRRKTIPWFALLLFGLLLLVVINWQ